MGLTHEEKQALDTLVRHGWQVVYGAHLEDWDEGQHILNQYGDPDSMEVRSDVAVIRVEMPAKPE